MLRHLRRSGFGGGGLGTAANVVHSKARDGDPTLRPGRSYTPNPPSQKGPQQDARGPTYHDPAQQKTYSPTMLVYSVAESRPASPPAATRTLIIQPSPYGSVLIKAGSPSSRALISTISPATGM